MNKFLNFLCLCCLVFFCVCFAISSNSPITTLHIIPLLLTFLLIILYLYSDNKIEQIRKSFWIRPSMLLLLSLVIVNLQIPINIFVGLGDGSYYLESSKYAICSGEVLFFGCIGIISFIYGYHYRVLSKPHNNFGNICKSPVLIWVLLSLLSFILWVINIDLNSFFTGMEYQGSGAADRVSSPFAIFETLLDCFITISFAVITKNNINRKNVKWSFFLYLKSIPMLLLLVIGFYMGLRTMSGDRGPVIYTGLMLFYSYVITTQKKIKLLVLVSMVIVGAFSLTLLNVVRNFRNPNETFSERLTRGLDEMGDNTEKRTISPFTHELAKSVNCNYIAVYDIDNNITTYKYGGYNISELLVAVPGMNRVFKTFFDIDLYKFNSNEYLTISCFGKNYLFGLGTTALADFYLDFGILGMILGMFLIGFIYKRVDYYINNPVSNILLIICLLKFSSMSIYMPRASLSLILCRIFYILIIYYIFSRISLFFYTKKNFINVKK